MSVIMIATHVTGEHSKGYIKSLLLSEMSYVSDCSMAYGGNYNSSPAVFSLIASSISAFCTDTEKHRGKGQPQPGAPPPQQAKTGPAGAPGAVPHEHRVASSL